MSENEKSLEIQIYTGGVAATNGMLLSFPGNGQLLIDAPEGIVDWLDARGAKPSALLLTHQHFDHVMDAAEVAERWEIPIYAFAEHSKDLTLEERLSGGTGMLLEVPKYSVNHLLEGEDLLKIEGFPEMGLLHVPGHSPDSVGFFFSDEQLLFSGDILFAGSVGRSDFPNGDGELLVRGIREKVFPLGDGVTVYPGHGPEILIGDERRENPYCGGV